MKRLVALFMMVAIAAAFVAVPAEAAKKKKKPAKRVQELRYENPAIGTAGAAGCAGCPQFSTGPGERFLSVEITDDVSPIGYADISYDSDGDGISDTGVTVCGATEGAVEVPESTTFTVFPYAIPSPFCVGSSTAGTLKLTFSATP
jgi:hypothetical protein